MMPNLGLAALPAKIQLGELDPQMLSPIALAGARRAFFRYGWHESSKMPTRRNAWVRSPPSPVALAGSRDPDGNAIIDSLSGVSFLV
jgi:hypothetical protein